jgi:FtsH-binding integral membrane protein
MSKENKRSRDFLLYVGIAIVVVVIAAVCATYAADNGLDIQEAFVPTTLFFTTLFLFGWFIQCYRHRLKSARFWGVLTCMFVIHLVAGALVLRSHLFARDDLLLALIVLGPEYMVIKCLLAFALKDGTGGRKV